MTHISKTLDPTQQFFQDDKSSFWSFMSKFGQSAPLRRKTFNFVL